MVAPPPTVDHYAALQIPPTADEATIKSAYRRLARLTHPDKNTNTPGATAEFQQLTTAYAVLSDKNKRRRFDLQYKSIRKTKSANSWADLPTSQNDIENGSPPHARANQTNPPHTEQTYMQEEVVGEFDADLQQMESKKRKLQHKHSEATRDVQIKQSAIDSLEVEHEQEIAKERLLGDISTLSEKEKGERTRRETRRRVDRMVVEMELRRCKENGYREKACAET
ncbi:hypothetical protein QQZ08_009144 [Neonectria magnoliae]|uniref:J domain-containing protein n=1 Tax=Neonectria magnoliae TaxID=2732573 RepID=A0ABR1HPV1_9HYPO